MIDVTGIEKSLSQLKKDQLITDFLEELGACGPSLVLGGAVRDWILGNPHRDIDIVVACPTKKLQFLNKYKAQKNRFEGYYLTIGGTEFDIWTVESTWAMKKDASFDKTLEAIPRTVFLTIDAVGYRLDTKEIYDSGFHASVLNRRLGIIYEPNPFPFLCVSRSLCTLLKYDLLPTYNLKAYIQNQFDRGYNKGSFSKYLEMRHIDYDFDKAMEKVNNGSL